MSQSETNASEVAVAIGTERSGFYEGFNQIVVLVPKLLLTALILWVGLSPSAAGEVLLNVQNWSTTSFGGWYIYVTAFYTVVCLTLALWPRTAQVKLGRSDEEPEFYVYMAVNDVWCGHWYWNVDLLDSRTNFSFC